MALAMNSYIMNSYITQVENSSHPFILMQLFFIKACIASLCPHCLFRGPTLDFPTAFLSSKMLKTNKLSTNPGKNGEDISRGI
jgi:hypothetical protein